MVLFTTNACTLPTQERPLRLAEFDADFADAVTAVETGDNTATLTLSGGAGLGDRLRDLTARESTCCSFFTFTVTGSDDELRLTITVPPGHADLLRSLVERADLALP